MPAASITVSAPSRLHFGLLSFGGLQPRQYGGAGVMIRQPGLVLRVAAAEQFQAAGPLSERAATFARRFAESRLGGALPRCRLEVLEAPPQHVGLGLGTQLGLSVATALAAWAGLEPLSPAELATSVGRGRRSAVGVYGFCHGGMIVEAGRLAEQALSPLVARIVLPAEWRFLLVRPGDPAARKSGHDDIVTWGQLGLTGNWASRPLSLYGRNSASGTYGYFKEHALWKGDFKDTVKEQPGTAAVVNGVANDRVGIGYGGIGYLTSEIRAIPLSKKSGDPLVEPSFENALAGKYPLGRALYVYVAKKPGEPLSPLVREFLKFVLSKQGQEIVVKDGYGPLPSSVVAKQVQTIGQ